MTLWTDGADERVIVGYTVGWKELTPKQIPFLSAFDALRADASPGHERPCHASPRIGRSRGVPWALYAAASLTYVTYSHHTCYLFTPREVPSWRLSEVLQVPAPAGPF